MIELPTEAVGFHGPSRAALPHLLAGEIEQSDPRYEWLGTGFYLWHLALASSGMGIAQHGESDAAVVAARVHLDSCLDLLNPRWQALLADADAQFVLERLEAGEEVPVNRGSGNCVATASPSTGSATARPSRAR